MKRTRTQNQNSRPTFSRMRLRVHDAPSASVKPTLAKRSAPRASAEPTFIADAPRATKPTHRYAYAEPSARVPSAAPCDSASLPASRQYADAYQRQYADTAPRHCADAGLAESDEAAWTAVQWARGLLLGGALLTVAAPLLVR